jgi:hypothetical protein
MDAKELKKKNDEYKKAKSDHINDTFSRDRAIHGEGSTVKYDPSTGTLKGGDAT